jgi:hypothetical protein
MDGSIMRIEVAECLECECKILLHKPPQPGQIIFCPDCHARFEVSQVKPLELAWAESSYEDEDDGYDDYDYDFDD